MPREPARARAGPREVLSRRLLIPIFPFNLQNYVYGITSIGFGAYVLVALSLLPRWLRGRSAALDDLLRAG